MCFTGNFALAMLPEPAVLAPVLSQPSLPLGFTKKARRGLYLSEDDLGKVQDRMAAEPDLCLLGLRFTGDRLVPATASTTSRGARRPLRRRWRSTRRRATRTATPRVAHSVLTEHLIDEPGQPTRDALEQVLDLFRTRLLVS